MIVLLCVAGFIASFVDAIVGGGGLISLPAFLMSGLTPHVALGTNKFSASMGSFTSSYEYIRSKKAHLKLMKILIPFTLFGAVVGVNTTLLIPAEILNILIVILIIAIALYTLFSKKIGVENTFKELTSKNILLGIIFSFSLGFYDGFFGPGTGAFLLFGFIKIYHFDFINATGNAKILNFTSNLTSLVLFALNKKIDYLIGIPVGLCMIAGAKVGSRLALNKGTQLIKPLFVTMSAGMVIKLLWELF